MSLESDMRAAALAVSNITSLIGQRFHPSESPADGLPAIVYTHIFSDGDRTLGGVFVERRASYQWRLVAETYAEIVQLKAAVNELAGTSPSGITKIDITEGPDGYEFETKRYIRIINVYLIK